MPKNSKLKLKIHVFKGLELEMNANNVIQWSISLAIALSGVSLLISVVAPNGLL